MPPAAFSPLGRTHVLPRTLRPSNWLGSCWTGLFEYFRIVYVWLSIIHIRINRQKSAIIQQSPDR